MFLILNTDGIGEGGAGIFRHHRPSRIHYSKEKAREELIRLKKKCPDSGFMLFQAVEEIDFDGVVLKNIEYQED
jgi:hypothetical protein